MPDEAAAHYVADHIELELSNEELAILIKLQALALDYVQRRLNRVVPPAPILERTEERLSNLGYRLEHAAKQIQWQTFVEGDCIVFLAHRGNPMAVGPMSRADYEFMRAPSTVDFILKMKQALDNIHEGYRHIWMLNDEPPVKIQPNLPV